jgi:hypothetical protein
MRSSRAAAGSILLCCGLALLALSGSAGCAQSKVKADRVEAVSVDVEPRIEPFRTTPVPAPLLPRVPSRGDCAPRYGNGTLGTCVNDKPCRGFGVLDGSRVICACFVKRGGCDEDERCEARESRCVKDDVPEFNLTP